MAKRTVQQPLSWMTWDRTVEVERVDPPAFYTTAYRVFADRVDIGYVVSRRERGHTTLWSFGLGIRQATHGAAPSRALAVDALLTYERGYERGYEAAESVSGEGF